MFEPVRGGTRGGQAEFKWSDVSADKDRENYLGHSINAPTGRWQKNKDVHWYNREAGQTQAERDEEIRKIKELEADALAVALGFEPAPKAPLAVAAPTSTSPRSPTSPTAIAKPVTGSAEDVAAVEKAEKHRRKADKEARRARKEERRSRKAERSGHREQERNPGRESDGQRMQYHDRTRDWDYRDKDDDRYRHDRDQSGHREKVDRGYHERTRRSRSRPRSLRPTRTNMDRSLSPRRRSPSRSRTPPYRRRYEARTPPRLPSTSHTSAPPPRSTRDRGPHTPPRTAERERDHALPHGPTYGRSHTGRDRRRGSDERR
ncbi:hypothetical protein H0H81_001904 [Sphagnurus paluster]|uniref:Multiple myeloma tumor-associated protein 2-like N-terminal domain-containing protein n=1 Tax=Sphagnurus paluster TaxID=117069 RepID=A0A9P7KGQ9_9AGAR|nr:hypothetical protein H0H81_001904 [Sphagnurus paluster]